VSAGRPPRAVIDTSTLYSPGNRKAITRLAAEGTIVAIWSPWIVAELVRILTLAWIDRHGGAPLSRRQCSAAARVMMLAMEPNFLVVAPRPPYPPSWPDPDPGDEPIWAAAKVAGAAYVVSENHHDFPPRDVDDRHIYEGIEYLSCAEFLRRYDSP
jgi:hypothetical protein